MKLEVWKSSQNQEERHYFIPRKGKGYQANKYVFGYNPEVVELRKVDDDLYELLIKEPYAKGL